MKLKKHVFSVVVAIVLLVSVFSAGMVITARGTEDDIAILVHKRTGNLGPSYFSSDPGYELVEDYGSFMLIETSEDKAAFLHEQGYVVEKVANRDHVGLQSYSFRTGEGEPDIPEELKIEEYPGDSGYYIVQFIGPIREEWKGRLEDEGVVLHEFRQRFNFIVEMDDETKREVEDLDFVNWVGIYQPAYRFDQDLLEKTGRVNLDVSFFEGADISTMSQDLPELGGVIIDSVVGNRISLNMHSDRIVDLANINGVKSISEGVEEYRFFNHFATGITQTGVENYRKVTDAGVTGVDQLVTVMDSELNPEHEMFYDDAEIGPNHRKIEDWYVPPGSRGDLDAGVMHGTHVTGTVAGNAPPFNQYEGHDGHAMHARVIFQDVSDDDMGMLGPPEDMYNDGYGSPYDRGSRIHTNSWGGRGEGEYMELTQESDQFVWDHQDMTIMYAAGNVEDEEAPLANTLSPMAAGKNMLSVGMARGGGEGLQETNDVVEGHEAQDNIRLQDLPQDDGRGGDHESVCPMSSRGYAQDGRIAPTIIQIGHITSSGEMEEQEPRGGGVFDDDIPLDDEILVEDLLVENGILVEDLPIDDEILRKDIRTIESLLQDDDYSEMPGTSMACPGIAGQAAQIRQYYEEGWHVTGSPDTNEGFNPSSALVRATLINGAVEMTGGGSHYHESRFPNLDQGFGRSLLDRVLQFEGDSRHLEIFDSWDEGRTLSTGDTWNMTLEVEDPSEELEVTLAWNDYPGPLGADRTNPALVNDLDLELTGPDGTRYVGNAFTGHNPGYSEPDPDDNYWNGLRDGEYDGLNNEQTILLLPDQNGVEEGTYKVTVTAHNVPEGEQPFAVVASGGIGESMWGDPPSTEIVSPAEGDVLESGTEQLIEWTATGEDDPIEEIDLLYRLGEHGHWVMIQPGPDETGDGSYLWEVPEVDEPKEGCVVQIVARDTVGRESEENSGSFTVVPPPSINIESPEDDEFFGEPSVTVRWQSEHTEAHEIELNGNHYDDLGPGETSYTFEGLDEREHTVNVIAVGGGDLTDSDSVRFTVDMTPPDLEIRSPDDGDIFDGDTVRLEWSGTPVGSDIDEYLILLNGLEEATLEAEDTSYTFEALDDGEYEVELRAVDVAGNEQSVDMSFTIDTTPPDIQITSPNEGDIFGEDSVVIRWNSASDPTSVQEHIILLNGQEVGEEGGDVAQVQLSNLDEGENTVEVMARDEAGNEAVDIVNFIVDTVPPDIDIIEPEDEKIFDVDEVSVYWEGTPQGTDIVEYEVNLNEEGWQSADSNTGHDFDRLSEGEHLVEVRITDEAGNEATTSITFTVDTVDPELDIEGPMYGDIFSVDTVTVHWYGTPQGTDIVEYEVCLDDGEWEPADDETEHTFWDLSEGEHTVEVRATDEAQNYVIEETSFIVDTVAPLLDINTPDHGVEIDESTVTIQWDSMPQGTNIVSYEIRINDGEWNETDTATNHTFEKLEDGDYTVDIRITDEAGHTTFETVEFTVDTFSICNLWWLFLLIAVIVVVLALLVWKRRESEEEEGAPQVQGQMWEQKRPPPTTTPPKKDEEKSEPESPTMTPTMTLKKVEKVQTEKEKETEDGLATEDTQEVVEKTEEEDESVTDEKTEEEDDETIECTVCRNKISADADKCVFCGEELTEEVDEEIVEEIDEEIDEEVDEEIDEEVDEEIDEEVDEEIDEEEVDEEVEEEVFGDTETEESELKEGDLTECPLCGREVEPGSKKCYACGEDLTNK